MPWGVEIYGLLTRWNPLNVRRPYALPYNGRNVLVVGLGPAGYTLAHYLLNEGFGVVAIDGLKIEPLPDDADRRRRRGAAADPRLGRDLRLLDERVLEGFGGVSEYGITVRWDKNFLTLHPPDAGAPRTSCASTAASASAARCRSTMRGRYGFDHVAIAAGAGRPTIIDMKNNLMRGIRKASDFLMALQLTGAFKRDALPNLQARLPAVVIGGGLTGIDTATELFAYYPMQVEKTLERYEALVRRARRAAVRAQLDAEEQAILDEFLEHGRAVRAERAARRGGGRGAGLRAARARLGRRDAGLSQADARLAGLSPESRGGDQGARRGHRFAENLDPLEIVADDSDHVRAMVLQAEGRNGPVELPARTVLVAAGTVAQHHLREGAPGHVPAGSTAAVLPGLPCGEGRRRRFSLEPTPTGSSRRTTTVDGFV